MVSLQTKSRKNTQLMNCTTKAVASQFSLIFFALLHWMYEKRLDESAYGGHPISQDQILSLFLSV